MKFHREWLDDESTSYVAVRVDDDSDNPYPPRMVTIELQLSDGRYITTFDLVPTGDLDLDRILNFITRLRVTLGVVESSARAINDLNGE